MLRIIFSFTGTWGSPSRRPPSPLHLFLRPFSRTGLQKTVLVSFTGILGSRLFWGNGACLEESSVKFHSVLQEKSRSSGADKKKQFQRRLRFLSDLGSLRAHRADETPAHTAATQRLGPLGVQKARPHSSGINLAYK